LTGPVGLVRLVSMSENKAKIGISMDQALLDRIDRLCELRNEPRSAFIERVLSNEIGGEERFMAGLENPLVRGFVRVLVETPGLVEAVTKAAQGDMSAEEIKATRESLPGLLKAARRNKRKRKGVADGSAELGTA
jgi:hypothetical protein